MKTSLLHTALRHAFTFLLLGVVFHARTGQATGSPVVPSLMAFQGYLTDASGNPLGSTNSGPKAYDVVLRLWDTQTGGATNSADELYAEQQTVIVNNGYFSVQLGQGSQYANEPFQAAGLAGYFYTNSSTGNTARYWETTVLGIGPNGGNITIAPRLACLSAPYALLAANAVNAANLVNGTGTQLINASGTAVTINGTTVSVPGTVNVSGNVTAANLSGNGAGLTGLNAGNISAGTLPIARGGTGSGTQNFVDLTSAQAIGGTKNFTGVVGLGTSSPIAQFQVVASAYGSQPAAIFQVVNCGVPCGQQNYQENIRLYNSNPNGQSGISFLTAASEASNTVPSSWIGTDYGDGAGPNNLKFATQTSGALVDRMYISGSSGNIGIGTVSPGCPLDVSTSVAGISANGYLYFNALFGNGFPFIADSGGFTCSIRGAGEVVAQGFMANSDARIKRPIRQSNSSEDLALLNRIKVTDYTYIDQVAMGHGTYKKVIAQELEQVYPQAVGKSVNVVPDLYQRATVQDGWVQLATDLKVGERVKLIGEKESGIHEVLEVRKGAFRTDLKPATDQVFVFGREVKDFRTVDYEAISMLNVSATQELARKVTAQEQEIADLKKLVAQLAAESKSAKLAAQASAADRPAADVAPRKLLTTASLER